MSLYSLICSFFLLSCRLWALLNYNGFFMWLEWKCYVGYSSQKVSLHVYGIASSPGLVSFEKKSTLFLNF